MRVELDIFSGRPNPQWLLDVHDAATVEHLLDSLDAGPAAQETSVLGYRGFVIDTVAGTSRACCGVVSRPSGSFADPLYSVERFLVQHLPDDLSTYPFMLDFIDWMKK